VRILIALTILLGSVMRISAESKTFRNEGLKNETVVRLDVQGKKVTGTFVSAEYGDATGSGHEFSGEIVPAPKRKRGVCIQIRFEGEVPYNPPPATKVLLWYLRIVEHRAHLFIPMQERSYEGKTPKWIVSEVELVPER
jgi:hypothetical protein